MKFKAAEGRLFIHKNRVITGILLIAAAIALAFFLYPRCLESKQEIYPVVSARRIIPSGSLIQDPDLNISETADKSLAKTVFTDPSDIAGKIATRDILPGGYIFRNDVSDNFIPETIYNTLPEGHVLISIAVSSVSQSVAGQLRAGDIVQMYSLAEDGSAFIPSELQYMKVLAVHNSKGEELAQSGYSSAAGKSGMVPAGESVSLPAGSLSSGSLSDSRSNGNRDDHEAPSVISLLATQEQAVRIVELGKRSEFYLSLVSRDNDDKAARLLEIQRKALRGQAGGRAE